MSVKIEVYFHPLLRVFKKEATFQYTGGLTICAIARKPSNLT